MPKYIYSLDLKVHMLVDSIIYCGNLFQSSIILCEKKYFLQFRWLNCL